MITFACGHPWTVENIQLMSGWRRCKTCNHERAREGMRLLRARVGRRSGRERGYWSEAKLTERWADRRKPQQALVATLNLHPRGRSGRGAIDHLALAETR